VSYAWMALTVTLATYACVSFVMTPLAIGLWRLARRDPDAAAPADRAAGLLLVRALPVLVPALLVAGLVSPAFHLFEPRQSEEVAGRTLVALAAAGAGLLALGVGRGWRAVARTRRLLNAWTVGARTLEVPGSPVPALRIDWPVPLVATVGILRPRLVVARQVLDACTPEQLTAVVAHEAAHLAARDNLKRLFWRSCPDLLALTATGRRMEHDWALAAEESADDRAARPATRRAIDLAEALVTVARLAPPAPSIAETALASPLIEASDLERRVRRLLGERRAPRRLVGWLVGARLVGLAAASAAVAGVLAAAGLIAPHWLADVQALVELAVATLR
jgi:hypothetical protein